MNSSATMASSTTSPVDNGVNVAALLGAREALTAAPEAARFQWRATSEWLRGTHSRATIDQFYGLGAEQKHRQTYRYESDHPEVFASPDNGATPVEFVLVGLAGCLTAGVAAVAQHRNIQLRSVKAASRCTTRSMPTRRRSRSRRWSRSRRSVRRCSIS
jgi:organic hydroperoxide reductase OsmC/OhrA